MFSCLVECGGGLQPAIPDCLYLAARLSRFVHVYERLLHILASPPFRHTASSSPILTTPRISRRLHEHLIRMDSGIHSRNVWNDMQAGPSTALQAANNGLGHFSNGCGDGGGLVDPALRLGVFSGGWKCECCTAVFLLHLNLFVV